MPWTAAHQAPFSFTISQSSLKFISIESVMLSNHLILCCPLFLLPLVFPSIGVFFNELTLCITWPKNWSLSISPSNGYSGLISFRIDWLDLLAIQEALKSLRQHHNSKASILQGSAFFTVQLSQLYMTTGKTTALTIWIFVGKEMSLLFNILSWLVIALLLRQDVNVSVAVFQYNFTYRNWNLNFILSSHVTKYFYFDFFPTIKYVEKIYFLMGHTKMVSGLY